MRALRNCIFALLILLASRVEAGKPRICLRNALKTLHQELTVGKIRPWHEGLNFVEIERRLASEPIRHFMHMAEYFKQIDKEYSGTLESEVYLVELSSGLLAVYRPRSVPDADLAGYVYANLLGKKFVPPVVLRETASGEPFPRAKSGSMQLFVEHEPRFHDYDLKKAFFESMDPDLRSDIDMFLGTFGQFDTHLGNLEFDPALSPLLFDFETAGLLQKVQWGDYPFVRFWSEINRRGRRGPFPFASPQSLHDPRVEDLLEVWGGLGIDEDYIRSTHERIQNIPDRTLNYVLWNGYLWSQSRLRGRRPFFCETFPADTVRAARAINLPLLRERLPRSFRQERADGIHERIQIYLQAARAAGVD